MTEELKPCPACGHSPAILLENEEKRYRYSYACGNSHCGFTTLFCSTVERAAMHWNYRPLEDKQKEEENPFQQAFDQATPLKEVPKEWWSQKREEIHVSGLSGTVIGTPSEKRAFWIVKISDEEMQKALGRDQERPPSCNNCRFFAGNKKPWTKDPWGICRYMGGLHHVNRDFVCKSHEYEEDQP